MAETNSIGKMDKVITIQRGNTKVANDLGEMETTWVTLGNFHAAIEYVGDKEKTANSVMVMPERIKFTIRFQSINPVDRIVYDAKYWDIEAIRHIERNKFTVIEAVSRKPLDGVGTSEELNLTTAITPYFDASLTEIKYTTDLEFKTGDYIYLDGMGAMVGLHEVVYQGKPNTVLIEGNFEGETEQYTVYKITFNPPMVRRVVEFVSAMNGTATKVRIDSGFLQFADLPVDSLVELKTNNPDNSTYIGNHLILMSISPTEFIIGEAYDKNETATDYTCTLIDIPLPN